MSRQEGDGGTGGNPNCHPAPRNQVPHVKDLQSLQVGLAGAGVDVACFEKLVKGETPVEDQMEHNYLLGDQLLYLQGQYERLLRKQTSQAAYKLEYLLEKLKNVETPVQFESRLHKDLLNVSKRYNRHHFMSPHLETTRRDEGQHGIPRDSSNRTGKVNETPLAEEKGLRYLQKTLSVFKQCAGTMGGKDHEIAISERALIHDGPVVNTTVNHRGQTEFHS